MSQRYAGGLITATQNANYSPIFNGTANYLTLAGAAQYAIATSTTPFTIEAWVRPTAPGSVLFAEEYTGLGNTVAINCSLATAAATETVAGLFPAFGWYNGSAWTTAAASTTPIALNIWSHVAFVFTGSTSKVYINGVDVTKSSSPTPATTWGVTATNGSNWYIGKRWDNTATNLYFKGNINNFRFVNGTAVYTSNFAPPARLSNIANTALLTCQSATIIDNSSYAATITNNGSMIVTDANPFYSPPDPALGAATPGVWTLNQATSAAAKRSWPMYDPEVNLNTAMVHGNGTNGSSNNTFLDSSVNNVTVTRNGNATQGTFTPFSDPAGYWSAYFGGSGNYAVTNSAAFTSSTTTFTVEAWVFLTAAPTGTNPATIGDMSPTAASNNWSFGIPSTLRLTFYWNDGAAKSATGSTRLSLGVWYHIAVSVSGNAITMYVNGVQEILTGTTILTNRSGTTGTIALGQAQTASMIFIGYMSNVSILSGVAKYSSSFTVPSSPLPTNTTGQVFLFGSNNRFYDANTATTAKTVTATGTDVRTIAYSPFYPTYAYTPQVNGGGMAFDGTGDYLSIADTPALEPTTSEFCIEAFFYTATVAAGTAVIIGKRATSAGFGPILIARSTATIRVSLSSNNSSYDIANSVSLGTITTNQWYHVAVYRVGNAWYGSLNGTITTLNASFSSFLADTNDSWLVGSDTNGNGFNGFISNPRFVIGSSVYSGSSAPIPTAPFTPTSSANTQLLLSGTNASIFDNANNTIIETVNTTISTAQNKYGSGTIAFNGTNAYAKLITPFASGANYGPNLIQTRGDFTIEAWVNPTNISAIKTIFYINGGTGSYASVRLDHNASGLLNFLVSFNNASWSINLTTTAITLPSNTWTHLAVVRAGPSMTVYLNGVSILASTTITMANTLYVGLVSVLGAALSTNYTQFFNGYMSDFRVTNYARYLGTFTPPTSTLQNQ